MLYQIGTDQKKTTINTNRDYDAQQAAKEMAFGERIVANAYRDGVCIGTFYPPRREEED